MRARLAAAIVLTCVGLWACEGKDVGQLLSPKPCVGPSCEPPPPIVCTSTATITCGRGVCLRTVPECLDGIANACVPGDAADELCNDLDDDCDGQVDEGCDDDGDGYCDAAMTIVGAPAVCVNGGALLLDCDDEVAQRHPGHIELCDDFIDNDCDELADYLDFNGCTHITASFEDADGLITLEHGTSQVVRAALTPPTLEISRSWDVTSAVPDTNCRTSDVMLTEPNETPGYTARRVSIVDDPSKLDCEYRLVVSVGNISADTLRLRMRNTRPRVDQVIGAELDDNILVLSAAAGRDPRLTAVVPEDKDEPVVVSWGGRDSALLDCNAPCEGASMSFRTPPPAGTYLFTLSARDAFDGVARARTLRVEVSACVWVRVNGAGDGSGPALANALGALPAAVAAAVGQSADVCFVGTGRVPIASRLEVPNGVSLIGGFSTGGIPAATKGMLRLANGGQLAFAPGATSSVRRLVVDAARASTMVDVVDASPSFLGVEVVMPAGANGRALRVTSGIAGRSVVRFASSSVRTSGAQQDATGIEVEGSGGLARLVWNGIGSVEVSGCIGECRGIAVRGTAEAELTADVVDVEASGPGSLAYAVDVAGTASGQPSADLRALSRVTARTTFMDPADRTVAVRLHQTRGVRITGNILIGATNQDVGRRFSAGIADGELRRDGSFDRGMSTDLEISGNRQINAGRASWSYNGVTCADEPEAREGVDVGAGIILIGTATAVVSGNGSNATRDTAVFGAASSASWDPNTRALPPSVPGIWTVDTRAVQLVGNEVRAGVLSMAQDCPPGRVPWVSAVRDGLGPFVADARGSRGLLLDKNGIGTGRRGSFDSVPNVDAVGSRGVELSGGDGTSAYLTNNYVAVTRGADLVGFYAHQTSHVELYNDVIEVEALGEPGGALNKQGIVLDGVAQGSFHLINTIVLIREDEEDATDPVALQVRGVGGLGSLNNNLLFVEAEERGASGAYVQVEGGARYGRSTFATFAAQVGARGTLILPPLFQGHALEHRRSITRLSDRSPARDAGQLEGAPVDDRFSNPRPVGFTVDIGHHELQR